MKPSQEVKDRFKALPPKQQEKVISLIRKVLEKKKARAAKQVAEE